MSATSALPDSFETPVMGKARTDFRPKVGQHVQIADMHSIMRTLDANGCSDGMPLMTEMLRYCGQAFPVLRWANTVCIFGKTIEFRKLDDCVILDMPRCCGSAHGGCQMACALFWKTQWLRPAESNLNNDVTTCAPQFLPSLLLGYAIRQNDQEPVYRCQATQLSEISGQQGSTLRRIGQEVNLNRVRVSHIASDFCSTLLAKSTRSQAGLVGPCRGRTPSTNLNLQVGDLVRVRSKTEIRETLDGDGKNRGMWFDPTMLQYCSKEMRVTRRVELFIDETTGKMIQTTVPSIVLDEQHCNGRGRRYCARLLHFFWREVWLESVDDK